MGTLQYANMSGIGRGGTGVLRVDGTDVATQAMERTIPLLMPIDESLDVGSDTLTGVNDEDYQLPFAFSGTINKITLSLDRPTLTPADIQQLQAAEQKAAAATE
jgi:arylsulfatase